MNIDQTQATSSQSQHTLLDLDDLMRKTKMAKTTLYDLIKNDKFPQPIKVRRRSYWVESEIDGWISLQIHARDQKRSA